MQKNVCQLEVLKQITERNAEKCASTRGFETDNGVKWIKSV
jgi:hypothetical protein